jgi:phage terminase small subunit
VAGNHRSGRKRIPTAVKRLLGAQIRADRRHEPTPEPGLPKMAAALRQDPYAVEEWRGLVRDLKLLRVLTVQDGRALALLAMAQADHRRLLETWALMGFKPIITQQIVDLKGRSRTKIIENPVVRQLRQQKALCDQLLGAFGMSPATRSKVSTYDKSQAPQRATTAIGRSLDLIVGGKAAR